LKLWVVDALMILKFWFHFRFHVLMIVMMLKFWEIEEEEAATRRNFGK
jgi:hypothetical protein